MKKRLRIGQLVWIEFLDHCANHDRPMMCRAYGKISSISKLHITITVWEVIGENKADTSLNAERFTIVRSAIRQVQHLQEV